MSKENHFHRLEIPHSINSISAEQTVNMAFKVTNDKPPPDKIIPKKTRKSEQEEAKLMIGKETLEFSSVGLKDNKCHSIQSPPFLDFLKPSFDFEVPKNPPSLKGKIDLFTLLKILFLFLDLMLYSIKEPCLRLRNIYAQN